MEKDIAFSYVKIVVSQNKEMIIIDVYDNGGGISNSNLEKIFDPYFSTKEEGKGTGIGLYMSKMLIEENMDGSLLVRNDERGARFTIVLNRLSAFSVTEHVLITYTSGVSLNSTRAKPSSSNTPNTA